MNLCGDLPVCRERMECLLQCQIMRETNEIGGAQLHEFGGILMHSFSEVSTEAKSMGIVTFQLHL